MGSIEGIEVAKEAVLNTFDELIRQRALDSDQTALVAYPKTRLGVDNYEFFTGRDLNRLIDGAAKYLIRSGVTPVYEPTVVGLYGTSDLDYAITIFGLGRLGYTSFLLSPRLPANACVALLKSANGSRLLYASQFKDIAVKTAQELPLEILPILVRSDYDHSDDATPEYVREGVDGNKEIFRKFVMMHSSGSTGLPRPIDYTHKRLMVTLLTSQDLIAFQSVPLFHAHGFVTFIQAIYKRKTIYMFNGNVPQTHDTVTAAIQAAKPEIVWTVPYVLKLLAEKQDGIDALKECKIVSCSGSRCPDELGDLMVANGIHFGTNFGATEVALLFSSLNRPREDKAWDYLRPPPHVAPFIKMKPIDGNICECVVLDGHRGKVMTNSNDPPNSFHTKDLFIAHPTIPNAWKFVGRLDDRVTLTNGEKVLPLPIEGRIQQDPLVKEAVIFGIDRPVPGLLLFRAKSAVGLSDSEFVDQVWPAIEDANSRAEGFSQITRDMIVVIPEEIDCPSTDKSSIKRAQVYREFAAEIDGVYKKLENSAGGSLKLNIEELEAWTISTFQTIGIVLEDGKTDFFAAGVDSLKAIQMRGLIIKTIDLGGNVQNCSSLIVYDCGNAEKLAHALYAIRTGEVVRDPKEAEIDEMSALIEKYSKFQKHSPESTGDTKSQVVVLTGATGSLGSHLLAQIVAHPLVSRVYCLIRTSPNQSASSRLEEALRERNLPISSPKIVPLSADLSAPDLGLDSATRELLKIHTTYIFHCAWEVNFALPVRSFEPQIAGIHNLIALSLSVKTPKPATLFFCSSIGTAIATPRSDGLTTVPEARVDNLSYSARTGYARSKLVAERILEAAVNGVGAHAAVFRIGQIIPSLSSGSQLWNPSEMIPLMVQSSLIVHALPLSLSSGESCSWLEVDTIAKTMVELGDLDKVQKSHSTQLVYNLVHPRPFSWSKDFLPALKSAGLQFETVPFEDWLKKLAASEQDTGKNPSRKLLGFWEEADAKDKKQGSLEFDTSIAQSKSKTLQNAEKVVDNRVVKTLVDAWRTIW